MRPLRRRSIHRPLLRTSTSASLCRLVAHDAEVLDAEVEELVDGLEGAGDGDVVLELDGDGLVGERLEEGEDELRVRGWEGGWSMEGGVSIHAGRGNIQETFELPRCLHRGYCLAIAQRPNATCRRSLLTILSDSSLGKAYLMILIRPGRTATWAMDGVSGALTCGLRLACMLV